MEEKNNKKKVLLVISSLILIIVLLIGITYAYFSAGAVSTKQEVDTHNLEIAFDDNTAIINNENIYPIYSKDIKTKAAKKAFTINVTAQKESYIKLGLDIKKIDEKLKTTDFKWALYEEVNEEEVIVSEGNFSNARTDEEYLLKNNIVHSNTSGRTYNLYIWLEETGEDQNALQGKEFQASIVAEGSSQRHIVYQTVDTYKITSTLSETTTRSTTTFRFADIDTSIFKADGTDVLTIDYRTDGKDDRIFSFIIKNTPNVDSLYSGPNLIQNGGFKSLGNISISETYTKVLSNVTAPLENNCLVISLYYSVSGTVVPGTYEWLFNIDDIKINGISIKDKLAKTSTNAGSIEQTSVKTLYSKYQNKKVAIIGDSISTTGAYSDSEHVISKGYWKIMNENLAFSSLEVNGWSGASISHEASYADKRFTKRYLELSTNNDLVLIFGGTNDYSTSSKLGTINDEPTDANYGTFYGSLKFLVEGLKANNPNGDIMFITPIPRSEMGPNTLNLKLEDYVNAIKNVANLYDLNICDMYTLSGFMPQNEEWKNKHMPDGVHPNQLGNDILGEKITKCLAGL